MLDNPFLGLDGATLATLKTKTLDAIQAVLLNQSYSLNGKSVSRADLAQLNNMLGNIQDAILGSESEARERISGLLRGDSPPPNPPPDSFAIRGRALRKVFLTP